MKVLNNKKKQLNNKKKAVYETLTFYRFML